MMPDFETGQSKYGFVTIDRSPLAGFGMSHLLSFALSLKNRSARSNLAVLTLYRSLAGQAEAMLCLRSREKTS